MELTTAISLIENGVPDGREAEAWLDLGAGSGLFTRALASVLPPGSVITAIDKSAEFAPLKGASQAMVRIEPRAADFTALSPDDLKVHGILMANSLHYVKDQRGFLVKVLNSLLPDGRLIVVEYNTDHSNMWVPHPISFTSLTKLLTEIPASNVTKLATAPSQFQGSGIYSALIRLVR